LEESFAAELPVFLSIQSFEIQSSEKTEGDDPVYKNEFLAQLQLTTDTYTVSDRDVDTLIIQQRADQGDIVEISGRTESRLLQGEWQITTILEESTIDSHGVPRDSLAGPATRIIMDGSEEASTYRNQKAKRLLAEARKRRALQPDYVTVQHILIGFEGSVTKKHITRTKEQSKQLAEGILLRAKEGEDFNSLVETYTDDRYPGIYSIANTGVLPDLSQGIHPREKMVRAFGDVSFSLQVGEIGMAPYDPLHSPYGWHIIKRLEFSPGSHEHSP
jgi:parvulin-like peptidyl-prolyl isomerase